MSFLTFLFNEIKWNCAQIYEPFIDFQNACVFKVASLNVRCP